MRIPSIIAGVTIGLMACSSLSGSEETSAPYDVDNPLRAKGISLPVAADPTFGWAPQPGSVNLGGMKSKAGAEPVLMALGDGVAAGYRDGGLFREGQITAYPNLVARQMGLSNFKQPLFGRDNGNGTGQLVIDKASNDLRWNEVTNNLAHEEKDLFMKFEPYVGDPVNNFSVPGLHPINYNGGLERSVEDAVSYYKKNPLPPEKTNVNYLWDKYFMPMALANRFMSSSTGTGWDRINDLKPDIGIIDVGMDICVMSHIRGNGRCLSIVQRAPSWELQILDNARKMGMKYVYTTVPDVLDFPYFKLYTYESVVSKVGKIPVGPVSENSGLMDIKPGDILLPTANVVDFSIGKFHGSFTGADVIKQQDIWQIEFYNDRFVRNAAKDYGHPLVDFYSIYKKVLARQYVSEDGFKIDPSFPDGNFFSSDGIYPSAIGQAVLANEVIKVFNNSYGMRIPLIDIGRYAAELGNN